MAEPRAKSLSALLPIALATGYSEVEPNLKPLKVRTKTLSREQIYLTEKQNFDSDLTVECNDTEARFAISDHGLPPSEDIEMRLAALRESWNSAKPGQDLRLKKKKVSKKSTVTIRPDSEWVGEFASHLSQLIDLRINHVRLWLDSNLRRFQRGHTAIEDLHRRFDNLVVEMKANVQLCGVPCASCHFLQVPFLCVRSRLHNGDHSCQTAHQCGYSCGFCPLFIKSCSLA